ncbi:MAG: glycoside hydrolase family 95 protein, partial [Proteobacteria bacterium]|nr:glycoside hydrolase family 95 protein [Pseudomonadota bacterium]
MSRGSRALIVVVLLAGGIAYFLYGTQRNAGPRSGSNLEPASGLRLWYPAPATDWMTQALPIGNAYMAAMLFGGIDEEHIQFNEESLWAGGPGEWDRYRGGNRASAYRALPEIRRLIKEGNYAEAHRIARRELTGVIKNPDSAEDYPLWQGFGAYQPFGDIHIAVPGQKNIVDYSRSLDLRRAVAEVRYRSGTVTHQRQYFASYPARLLVFKLQNDAPHGQDYRIKLSSPHPVTFSSSNNRLTMKGALANNGMALEARMEIRSRGGGSIRIEAGQVVVQGARELVVLLCAATDYLLDYPGYKGRDYAALNEATLNAAKDKDFDLLLHEHLAD